MNNQGSRGTSVPCTHRHNGEAKRLSIGGHDIWAGGGMYLDRDPVREGFDLRVELRAERSPEDVRLGEKRDTVLFLPIVDFRTISEQEWMAWIMALDTVAAQLRQDTRFLVHCAGGHGRTGLFLASLLVRMEPECDDPVAQIRRRYCLKAVETNEQYAQVMRLLRETRAQLSAQP